MWTTFQVKGTMNSINKSLIKTNTKKRSMGPILCHAVEKKPCQLLTKFS